MSSWDRATAALIGGSTELVLASQSPDGELSVRTTMWVVQVDVDLYVRSARGPGSAWYRRARAAGAGRIWAGGTDAVVCLEPIDPAEHDLHAAIDAAYHRKYDHYGPRTVGSVVGRSAVGVTLRLVPTA